MAEAAVVSGIFIYPVKSCRGVPLQSATLSSTGFDWDRQWMVVNARGRFITQRQDSRMALIDVSLPVEAVDRSKGPLKPDSALCFNAPGMEPLHVPLLPRGPRKKVPASVWEWSGLAFHEGSAASEWFSKYLGKTGCSLVRFDTAGETRLTDPNYAPGHRTAFSDGFPILLISEASLDALNERLPEALPMNRFRPNIVVKGSEAFAEDLWRKFKIGEVAFEGIKICSRCKITTTNQQTAEVGSEPLLTLKSFRQGQLLSSSTPSIKGQVYFGQNVIYDTVNGLHSTVNVGDKIYVLKLSASITELMNKSGA